MAENAADKDLWTSWHTTALLAVLLVIALVAAQTGEVSKGAPWTWYVVLALLAVFIVIAGQGIVGRWLGFLIDSRNKMTLSRLQLVLWTVVVLSAYLTAALARVAAEGIAALEIGVPEELWWLMGISTASMVGSPLILSNKKTQPANPEETKKTVRMLAAQEGTDETEAQKKKSAAGLVMVNASPKDARVADLFRGDETGNAAHLDLGKVQMLFFTLVLILAYFFALRDGFADVVNGVVGEDGKKVYQLPALSQSMVTLLGISHAGYLAAKATPQSQTAGAGATNPGDPPP